MVTNKRLIDAHDLWSDIMMLPHNGDMISSEEVEQAIVEAPTVEVVEVVYGQWEQGDYYDFGDVCSICDWDSERDNCMWSYCPNCGARMDGGK